MSLSVGIIGLPNIGKSTLLNALTHGKAEASNYPFCTIDQNVGIAEVPDENLVRLNDILSPEEAIPTTIQFTDIAGLVKGASQGEGLGNKFLSHIREAETLLHVVRCFEDDNISHVYGEPDPVRDTEVVEMELILADLKTTESRLEKAKRSLHGGLKDGEEEVKVYSRCLETLRKGLPLSAITFSEEEERIVKESFFLSMKPVLYVANVDESDPLGQTPIVSSLAKSKGSEQVLTVSVKIEEEIAQLSPEEGVSFLKEMGLDESGLRRVITACFRLLNLITFYTIANNKLRAWQLIKGSTAQQAAGKIHTDMQKGFIRAEVMELDDLLRLGSRSALQEQGLIKMVGRDHIVQDGEILQIHFKA
jgi:GTP-binding protein YchF